MRNPFKIFLKKPHFSEPTRHAKRSWKKRSPHFSFSNTMLALCLLFLFIPLFVIIFYSFNESKDSNFTNFSFVWYEKLIFNSGDLWASLWNSFFVAIT